MPRLLLLTFVLTACGDADVPDATVAPAAAEAPAPPVERQRLDPDQLAVFLPERIGEYVPIADSYETDTYASDRAPEQVSSIAQLRYKSPLNMARGSGAFDAEVRLRDARDAPVLAQAERSLVEREGERDGDRWVRVIADDTFGRVERTVWYDSGIGVEVTVKREADSPLSTDELAAIAAEVTDDAPVAALAEAPTFAEAEPVSGPPAWLGGAAASALAFASCDVALPVAEVERVCSASGVGVLDTGMVAETDCNRVYSGAGGDLIFLLSQYGDAGTARQGLRVASEDGAETRRLPDLGGGGYSFLSSQGDGRVAFVVGHALVEIKADGLCADRAQLESVAETVAERLTE